MLSLPVNTLLQGADAWMECDQCWQSAKDLPLLTGAGEWHHMHSNGGIIPQNRVAFKHHELNDVDDWNLFFALPPFSLIMSNPKWYTQPPMLGSESLFSKKEKLLEGKYICFFYGSQNLASWALPSPAYVTIQCATEVVIAKPLPQI